MAIFLVSPKLTADVFLVGVELSLPMREGEPKCASGSSPGDDPGGLCSDPLGHCLGRSVAQLNSAECFCVLVNRSRRGNDGVDIIKVDTLSCDNFHPSRLVELRAEFVVHEPSVSFFRVLRPTEEYGVGAFEIR